ncbi:biotin transporter BioY [Fredinandcohnia quinoae]|uniref:Biotin transporter n=1 Tax=Fredinandcohnia quinoae TaxID=2918902 RepID=A0AAW5DXX1_9BACI|nr:biotin transporter BioY [Fredinandcohnia sp. SECRCQ15]MCH1625517.1 biotin transporter BioY [Fredinandcohnia sp. SECRCQ15]
MTTTTKPKFRALDITLIGMFAALMAIGANITSWAPFLQVAGVPLSMQTFFAILAGLLIGSRLGALSMLVYMLIGIAGAPVFAGFEAGFSVIIGNTGGFVLSFIAVAYFAGKIVESSKSVPSLSTFLIASFVGLFLNYFIGTNYMYFALNYWLEIGMGYVTAWKVMGWFIVKDLAFTIFAALVTPRIYYAINRNQRSQSSEPRKVS